MKRVTIALSLFSLLSSTLASCTAVSQNAQNSIQPSSSELSSVAVAVRDLGNPFFVQVGKGAEAAAKKLGGANVRTTLVSSGDDLNQQFNQIENFIVVVTDTCGNRVGDSRDRTNTILANRGGLNFETSFTGRDMLRTRLEFANLGSLAEETGTNMTALNFDGNTRANAENSGVSSLSDGRGGLVWLNVDGDDRADIVYAAIGISFPDVGGEGNLRGILVGLPGRVTSSNVRRERDTSYHIEAFYRFQVNDNISITPAAWAVVNPENDSRNGTQWVWLLRTGFNF